LAVELGLRIIIHRHLAITLADLIKMFDQMEGLVAVALADILVRLTAVSTADQVLVEDKYTIIQADLDLQDKDTPAVVGHTAMEVAGAIFQALVLYMQAAVVVALVLKVLD
jgi:hypothetical protein